MAITIWHRIINNNNRVRIINKESKPQHRAVKVKGNIRATRHEISEVKEYD